MVIGSGPIVIGQAAEFDYAGVQACRALREEGHRVVLVNSNPATIMTDPEIADAVYLEPLTVASVERIIARERPDALLPTLGGQTGLNLAVELADAGVIEKYDVELLGTPLDTIKLAEDRERFKAKMIEIGEPVPKSLIVTDAEAGVAFANEVGYPLVVRPAYTLGGTGGGVVYDEAELRATLQTGLEASLIHQALVETSLLGWKEIEYEVLRDGAGNCIIVCNMENIDPVGVHTGDSIVVAPSQTLSDLDYQMLRTSSINVIRALNVQGGCNIQFALHPDSSEYMIIEVNPRVSRSSALASKATGYPIAKISTKIALGQTLDQIPNPVTGGRTKAAYEPTLDYCVVKFPRWPFDKFPLADTRLGTQMKSTGEAMGIGRTFAAALMKAVRGLDLKFETLTGNAFAEWSDDELLRTLQPATHERLFAVCELLRRGRTVDELHALSTIDEFWLWEFKALVELEEAFRAHAAPGPLFGQAPPAELVRRAFESGLQHRAGSTSLFGGELQSGAATTTGTAFRMVDTAAAEFPATSPYYYLSRGESDEMRRPEREAVVVVGSGPIRIGQGIEFDYSCVHAAWALRDAGRAAVVINNNPETVSTDFDISDVLVFEPPGADEVEATARRDERARRDARVRRPDRDQSRRRAREARHRDRRQRPPFARHGRRPREVRRGAREAGRRAAARARGEHVPRSARDRARDRLPRAGAAVVRAGRPRHGDRVQRRPARVVRRERAADHARLAAAGRQVHARPRGGGRRRVRRRRHHDPRDLRARRARRHPLRRLDQRVSHADGVRRHGSAHRHRHRGDRARARHPRARSTSSSSSPRAPTSC